MTRRPVSLAWASPLVLVCCTGVLVAGTIYDMKGAYKRVTIELRNETIESALRQIVDDPKIALEFQNLDADRRIAVKFDKTPRDQALLALARKFDLFYAVPSPKRLVVTQWSHLSKQKMIVPTTAGRGVPAIVNASPPDYPEVARTARFEGRVLVRITVEPDGSVTVGDMQHCDLNHASHGPSDMHEEVCPLFYTAAAEAMAGWKFESPTERGQFDVNLGFTFN